MSRTGTLYESGVLHRVIHEFFATSDVDFNFMLRDMIVEMEHGLPARKTARKTQFM